MALTLNEEIIKEAKTWLGVKYQHRSATKFGCDCTGLIIGIMQELGHLKSYKLRNYPIDWNLHGGADNHITEQLEKVADKVTTGFKPGDIVLFKFKLQKFVAHIGIAVGDGQFIHCWKNSGKVQLSSMFQWHPRLDGVYRFSETKLAKFEGDN